MQSRAVAVLLVSCFAFLPLAVAQPGSGSPSVTEDCFGTYTADAAASDAPTGAAAADLEPHAQGASDEAAAPSSPPAATAGGAAGEPATDDAPVGGSPSDAAWDRERPEAGSPASSPEPSAGARRVAVVPDAGFAVDGEVPLAGGGTVVASSGASGDAMAFWYDSFHGKVRFGYRESPAAPARAMDLAYERVVEFVDADGDGAYDAGEEIVQAFDVSGLPHQARSTTGPCGVRLVWTYALTKDAAAFMASVDGTNDADVFARHARLTLRFLHVGSPYDLDGAALHPDRVKIDVLVDLFPFLRGDTRIAVLSTVRSTDAAAVAPAAGPDPARVEAAVSGGRLAYAWEEHALVDGRTYPVSASVVSAAGSGATTMAFAYPAGAAVFHDPELGLLRGPATSVGAAAKGGVVAYALGAVALAVVLGAFAWTRRR